MQRITTGLLALAMVGGLSLVWMDPAKSLAADQPITPRLTPAAGNMPSGNNTRAKNYSKQGKPEIKQSPKQAEPLPEPKTNAKTPKNDSKTPMNDSKTPTKTLTK